MPSTGMLLLVLLQARSVSFEYDADISTPVYISNVRIERIRGPLRSAEIPAESEPVMFGVHAGVAEHYGVAPGSEAERATTLDYIVAAAGG